MTKERYESISLHDLREIAKNRGMKRISALKKADLIEQMLEKDGEEAKVLREEKRQRRKEKERQAQEEAQARVQDRDDRARDGSAAAREGYSSQWRTQDRDDRARDSSAAAREGYSSQWRSQGRDDRVRESAGPVRELSSQWRTQDRDERVRESAGSVREGASEQWRPQERSDRARDYGVPAREGFSAQGRPQERGDRVRDYSGSSREGFSAQGRSQDRSDRVRECGAVRQDASVVRRNELNTELDSGQMANGILDVMQDGFGFIRCANYMPGENDIYVAPSQIRRFGLKTGDIVSGNIRVKTQGEKFSALLFVKSVNGYSPDEATRRYNFEDMTPVFPCERIHLERPGGSISMRVMDLMCPVGKGQRGMIVSPPKAGKTTLIKEVARSVKINNPEIHLIVLLIDERPEEVTDIREAIEGPDSEVIYSTFDELPEHHKRVSEMVIERARRLVEHKKDVMILLDSITRLTRAYNLTEPSSGRTLSGGLDPAALHMPKRFFGAARKMREGGSLTILATALIDTGSKMDDIVFEEFKGTGNMELVLDRRLSERRIFPAIDIVRSGTRREDLLLTADELNAINTIRRAFNGLSSEVAVSQCLDLFARTRTNGEFVNMVRKISWGTASGSQSVN